ncbi:uroporphyrinogen-III synthase [Inhella proteolytica]|uniref:Uroporphyrinogen-III synthase n=1 Tax=Inhella proteolytica TaxID=2795029 RepID=A0A931NFF4_9BURK|nr:uroporphyrinogen-III synthase [Inhella proteolytica]MBH9578732.1 uroporphyrinogen-III synthase [Inhella proteolytica]
MRGPLVLTAPQAQQARWRSALQALGVPVQGLPLIVIGPAADPDAVAKAWSALRQAPRLAVFVSPSAVTALDAGDWSRWPAATWAACVGPGTAHALRERGVGQVLCPPEDSERFESESLWPLLERLGGWRDADVLLLRGDGGREWLAERLVDQGAKVQALSVYRRMAPPAEGDWARQARALRAQPALWLLTSTQSLEHGLQLDVFGPGATVLASHPRIAAVARKAGLAVRELRADPEAVAQAWRHWAAA